MAAESKSVANSFELTSRDRELIRASIALKSQSVLRASKGETNPEVAAIRTKEYDELQVLAARFR